MIFCDLSQINSTNYNNNISNADMEYTKDATTPSTRAPTMAATTTTTATATSTTTPTISSNIMEYLVTTTPTSSSSSPLTNGAKARETTTPDTWWEQPSVARKSSIPAIATKRTTAKTMTALTLLLLVRSLAAAATTATAATTTTAAGRGARAAATTTTRTAQFSQPLDEDDGGFRPIIPRHISPEYISRNVFTEHGQYRVFQPVESDLRAATSLQNNRRQQLQQEQQQPIDHQPLKAEAPAQVPAQPEAASGREKPSHQDTDDSGTDPRPLTDELGTELRSLEDLLVEYVENFFTKGQYEPLPGLVFELQRNHTASSGDGPKDGDERVRNVRQTGAAGKDPTRKDTAHGVEPGGGSVRVNIPRALQSGRLLFFTGLKKILWPIFVGLQILKSLLFAMFLPSLIGSFGRLVGKGIASASIRPMEPPQDLDFRDNSFNFDEDNNKFIIDDDAGGKMPGGGYAYNQPEASQTSYSYNAAGLNNQALSRYSINEKQHYKMPDSYMSALQTIGSASFKNSNSISGSSSQPSLGGGGGVGTSVRVKPAAASLNNFQTFQKVPASSLLLSNYDPFYSPLLSRLDSVFAQLKLNSENEVCREKLICLMYANPAKYAPYSNLVSAQLSRELNELRKPTSDNPDILRFFKYMRAAKDGQDGIDCEATFDKCTEFKDFENPAMVSTYHDINKLVQARKMA